MTGRKVQYARVSRVENFMSMLIAKQGISRHVSIDSMPVTIRAEWEDMVLIDVGKGKDMDAYNQFSVNVFLYAKPKGDLQQKDVKKLDWMEELLDKAIGECNDTHYHPSINWRDSDYDDIRNFHFNVINLSVTVTE